MDRTGLLEKKRYRTGNRGCHCPLSAHSKVDERHHSGISVSDTVRQLSSVGVTVGHSRANSPTLSATVGLSDCRTVRKLSDTVGHKHTTVGLVSERGSACVAAGADGDGDGDYDGVGPEALMAASAATMASGTGAMCGII